MNKNTWVIGFTLFAMFFGAGNLIFPPNLGLDSGQFFWPAILAFVLTGIGLPLLGVIVGALDKEGYIGALNKISPKFSILFLIIIYLTIGPLFAIPRTASTSFEMTITPIIHSNSSIALFIFTIIYFIVVLYICLNPSKLIDRIGSLLTPLLLITILAMIIKGYLDFSGNSAGKGNEALYHSNFSSFAEGFTQGYLTMDAIAAIALIFIYISLGYIGNHMPVSDMKLNELKSHDRNIGTYLLTTMASTGFGSFGKYLLGIIVALACLTTACGLIVAVSEYFHRIVPKVSYKAFVLVFILMSFIIANQGLNAVISMSIPVLSIVYPVAITVVLLILIAKFIPTKRITQQIPVIIVFILSIFSVISKLGWLKINFIESLPLRAYSLEWFPVAIIATILGYLVGIFVKQDPIKYQQE
ncbi:TPA: branched-chain amino acid transport system II carrier protein [Staphylococcus aureus]|uniref:branched-chain amino acid-like transporter carrier protein BrnQ3 n=1 Tax=Staphylococcus aureus TaxID=1280 RepID=UPI0007CA68BD|nr:branched-chain amino acid transport system II carrier protein [Staphylococcus aureus]SAN84185.1 Branched-chain amino acid transport system carrier protein [Staphylococcus aureus]HDA6711539.1 branched-chain amino acid transport system II carrier protein [Staphylococcus aureus]HEH0652929.1 branched-chain amino acid transport system II carrier protein [Staphylococcus aureus]